MQPFVFRILFLALLGMTKACSWGTQSGCGDKLDNNQNDFQVCMDQLAGMNDCGEAETSYGSIRCKKNACFGDFQELRQKLWDDCITHHDGQAWCRGNEDEFYVRFDRI